MKVSPLCKVQKSHYWWIGAYKSLNNMPLVALSVHTGDNHMPLLLDLCIQVINHMPLAVLSAYRRLTIFLWLFYLHTGDKPYSFGCFICIQVINHIPLAVLSAYR